MSKYDAVVTWFAFGNVAPNGRTNHALPSTVYFYFLNNFEYSNETRATNVCVCARVFAQRNIRETDTKLFAVLKNKKNNNMFVP